MIDCLGIVNFEDDRHIVEGLSDFRTIPAFSFLGRYRVVDFVLSNFVNSGMDQIKVLVKNKPRSLIEHLGSGRQYNINSKHGSLQILYTDKNINYQQFTDVALLKQYVSNIEEANADYVVVAPSYMINRIDYQKVLQHHVDSGAEITMIYKPVHDAKENFLMCDTVEVDGDKIVSSYVNLGENDDVNIYLETFVVSKMLFLEIINLASSKSNLYNLKNYLKANLNQFDVRGYRYDGYLRCINSLQQYFDTNLELLQQEKADQLLDRNWPIFTKTNDSPPTFYSEQAEVVNSLVSNGCVVQGHLENCIIGRGVKVKKGAVIKNSLILPGAEIGENAHIEYAVIDKNAKIRYIKDIIGDHENLMYVARGDTV